MARRYWWISAFELHGLRKKNTHPDKGREQRDVRDKQQFERERNKQTGNF